MPAEHTSEFINVCGAPSCGETWKSHQPDRGKGQGPSHLCRRQRRSRSVPSERCSDFGVFTRRAKPAQKMKPTVGSDLRPPREIPSRSCDTGTTTLRVSKRLEWRLPDCVQDPTQRSKSVAGLWAPRARGTAEDRAVRTPLRERDLAARVFLRTPLHAVSGAVFYAHRPATTVCSCW